MLLLGQEGLFSFIPGDGMDHLRLAACSAHISLISLLLPPCRAPFQIPGWRNACPYQKVSEAGGSGVNSMICGVPGREHLGTVLERCI